MVSVSPAALKGNNGRAAHRHLMRRIVLVAGLLLLICGALISVLLFVNNDEADSYNTPSTKRSLKHGIRRQKRGKTRPEHMTGMTDRRGVYESILKGEKHLVDLRFGDRGDPYSVQGGFCQLEWHKHKENPSLFPMFRDLMGASPDCEDNKVYVNLRELVEMAQERDDVNVLELGGAVFHESRCGSTLTANLLASWRPERHRVYSESTPFIQALHQMCGEDYGNCPLETAALLLRDVVYLMSRSDDPRETHVFFKVQSAGSRNVRVFQAAFPETPYLFVYRDPVQVMMSHLKKGYKSANCLRSRRNPGPSVVNVLQKYGQSSLPEDQCAAHLASITESIVESMSEIAIPINYKDMPDILFQDVFPLLSPEEVITAEEMERMHDTASVYSKARGERQNQVFEGDSERKEEMASDAVRQAAATYLQSSYDILEDFAEQRKQR